MAAYLARYKGSSREHTESDLRCYLTWCAERGLDPLAARRPHLELYIRWVQEIRRFKPSAISRRFSVTAGFYRTCVIDGLLPRHRPRETPGIADMRMADYFRVVVGPRGYAPGITRVNHLTLQEELGLVSPLPLRAIPAKCPDAAVRGVR